MQLYLTREQASTLIQDAQHQTPNEACGVIVGRNTSATEIIPLPNIAQDPIHHYRIDDRALVSVLARLEQDRLSLLGFYHSHPEGEPIPSSEDIRHAHYPDAAYVIVGLRDAQPAIAAWQIQHGTVQRVDLHIGLIGLTAVSSEPEQMSQAQSVAILLSAALAFVFLIVVALSLLPAPPPLP